MDSRTKNTKRNIITSYVCTLLSFLFQFVSRYYITRCLGEQYLGLSSLFTSVLQVLNMAELGFSGAIVYNMYRPIADGDDKTVCALLNYYRRVYRIIGVIVLIVGTIVMPFIPKLINGSYPSTINLYFLFGLYVVNTAVSYFLFAYKTSLLEAVQRLDITKVVYTIVQLCQYTFQLVALIVFKNYYLFVIGMILGTCAKNIFSAKAARKYYPQYECCGELPNSVKADIIQRVKGLLVCNISSVTYSSLDSIILSTFIGLTSVAIYGNYSVVLTGLLTIITIIRSSMQASVGNSVAKESIEKNYKDLLMWQYLFSVIGTFCTACLLSLYQPFMTLWMGGELLLPIRDVIIICAWFNVSVVQHAFFLYLSANGLWWELRWPYIGSTVCNLVLNIVLGKRFGITGIVIASFFSSFVFGLVWQCNLIFRLYFKTSTRKYFERQILYFLFTLFVSVASFYITTSIHLNGIIGLIVKAITSTIVSTIVAIALYSRSNMFKDAVVFVKKVIRTN